MKKPLFPIITIKTVDLLSSYKEKSVDLISSNIGKIVDLIPLSFFSDNCRPSRHSALFNCFFVRERDGIGICPQKQKYLWILEPILPNIFTSLTHIFFCFLLLSLAVT